MNNQLNSIWAEAWS